METTKEKQCDICWDSLIMSITKKIKEIEAKDKQLDLKEDELERKSKELEERFSKFDSDKEKLALREKQFEEKLRELEIHAVEIEEDRYTVAEQLRELNLKAAQFKDRVEEIESRSKDIESGKKELVKIQEKIEADERKMEERIREIDRKEKQMEGRIKALDLQSKDLERQHKELESVKRIVEANRKKSDERMHKLDQKDRELDEKVKVFESSKRRVDEDWKKLDYRLREVDRRERGLDRGRCDLRKEQKELELTKRKLEDDRKKLEERSCEVNRREKQPESDKRKSELELSIKKSDEALKELELKRNDLEEQLKKLESDRREFKVDREKLGERCRELEIKIKIFEENRQELESSKVQLERRLEQAKVMENSLDMKSKEIELKRSRYDNLCKKIVMDGKGLQIFLHECWRIHEKMGDGVSVLLGLSEDPAKLVLDALEGFFPPHLMKNGNVVEFAEHIVQRSCIVLLEQLLKISHDVKLKPEVKNEARRLSSVWISKLKPDSEHSIKILGFLLVLANYDAASNFHVDELFNYVKTVAHFTQVPELCCLLGMTDKIPGLIQHLIERKQHLVAIRYAFDFDLVEKFSLGSLLKDHMETSKIESAAIIESGNNSRAAQSRARTKVISDLRAAITCVEKYNISSEYSLAYLRQSIASLHMHDDVEKKEEVVHAPAAAPAAAGAPQWQRISIASSNPDLDSVDISSIESKAVISSEVWTEPLPKRRKLLNGKSISMNNADSKPPKQLCGNENDLGVLLRQNLDFCLMEDKAKGILRSSSDPDGLVFDAMRLCFVSTCGGISGEIPMKWCISLLKELRGYTIRHCSCELARKLGISWKKILKEQKSCNPMEIACYLLFHVVYQLGFTMKAGQVVPLINSLNCPKQLHYIFEQIGLPEFLPDMIKRWIGTNHRIQAIRYIHALQLGDQFPVAPLINEHLLYWNNLADERYKKGPNNPSDGLTMKEINHRLQGVDIVYSLVRDCELESDYPIGRLEEARNELIWLQRNTCREELKRKSSSSSIQQQQNNTRKEAFSVSSSKRQQSSSVSDSKRNQRLKRKQQKKRARAEQFGSRNHGGCINSRALPLPLPPPPPLPLPPPPPPPPHSGVFGFHPPPPPPPPNPFNYQQQGGGYSDIAIPFQVLYNSYR